MSGQREAELILKRLGRHAKIIADAYINNKCIISETSDNAKVISQLSHDRLVWRLDETGEVSLSSSIVELLDKALIRSNRRHIDLDVLNRLSDIEDEINLYRKAKKLTSLEDMNRIELEIQEKIYNLSENIKSVTSIFSLQVADGFSYVTNLELRIEENEKTIERANKLNTTLESLSITVLSEIAQSDPFLIRLLCQLLSEVVSRCREELIASLHILTKMLFSLKEQHHRSKLVNKFLKHFSDNPKSIFNTIDVYTVPPPATNILAPFKINAYPDIYDPRYTIHLAKLLEEINSGKKRISPLKVGEEFIDYDENPIIEIVSEPRIISDFYNIIGRVKETKSSISAMTFYYEDIREYDAEIWLLSVMNSFSSLDENSKSYFKINFVEVYDETYDGNYFISDLRIESIEY